MRDRLVLVPDQPRQRTEEVLVVDDDLVRVSADGRRDPARVVQLAECAFLECHGERLQRPVDHRRHQRRDGAAVETAGEEHPERHVGHQPDAHGFLEQIAEPPHEVRIAHPAHFRRRSRRRNVPVAADRYRAVLEHQQVPGLQPVNALEQRLGSRQVACAEQFRERVLVGGSRHEAAFEDRLDFRPEEQPVVCHRPVDRLDAQAIAREQQPRPARIPDRKREHPPQPVHAVVPPLLVRVHDCFGIGSRAIPVSGRFEIRTHIGMVVDLAVEDDPDRLVLVGERLVARRKVHDAQAAMGERGVLIDQQPRIVRTAVGDDVAHRDRAFTIAGAEPVGGDDPGDAAHG